MKTENCRTVYQTYSR